MADLAYDLRTLSSTADDLSALAAAFDGSGSYVQSREDAVGHPKVADALEHFVGNWRRHREKLSASLTSVAEMAQACHDGFRETDEGLADAISGAVTTAAP